MIPAERAFCRKHWYMLSKEVRDQIWAAYKHGTREDSLEAISAAARIIADLEGLQL